MKKWAYKEVTGVTEQQLNALGAEGWELVGISTTRENWTTYVFKRPYE